MYKYITLPMNLHNLIIMHYSRCTWHYFTYELT